MKNPTTPRTGTQIEAKLARWAELAKQRAAIDSELETIKASVNSYLQRYEKDEAVSGNFHVLRVNRPVWTYSNIIQAAEKNIKDQKKFEREHGLATAKDSYYLKGIFQISVVDSND